jgi:hypothetical protein
MKWLATLPAFPAVASTLRVDDRSLARISRAMVRMLAADDADFLHAVTGTHAYRTLEPYVADRNTARRYLWQALVAYALVQRAPDALGARLPARLPAWPEIIATAIADGGDHGLKLTYSALEEDLAYRDDHYRLVVARRLKLV